MALQYMNVALLLVVCLFSYNRAFFLPGFDKSQAEEPLQESGEPATVQRLSLSDNSEDARQTGPSKDCPGCAKGKFEENLTEDDIRQVRLDMIQKKILEKLRMVKAPNISTARSDIAKPLVPAMLREAKDNQASSNDKDPFYGETKEVILFAEEAPKCRSSEGCFHFKLKETMQANDVVSVELWANKKLRPYGRNDQILVASVMKPNAMKSKREKVLPLVSSNDGQGWMKFNAKHAVRHWLRFPERNHGIQIRCKNCGVGDSREVVETEAAQKPFLLVHLRSQGHHRARRSIECQPTTKQCCRDELYVDFAQFNWDSWLIHPKGYNANFCRGSCHIPAPFSSDQQSIARRMAMADTWRADSMATCCVPTQMSSLSVIYINDDGNLMNSELPAMVVDACGCS